MPPAQRRRKSPLPQRPQKVSAPQHSATKCPGSLRFPEAAMVKQKYGIPSHARLLYHWCKTCGCPQYSTMPLVVFNPMVEEDDDAMWQCPKCAFSKWGRILFLLAACAVLLYYVWDLLR